MAGKPAVSGGRTQVWAARLTKAESARADRLRGGLSKSAYMRLKLLQIEPKGSDT